MLLAGVLLYSLSLQPGPEMTVYRGVTGAQLSDMPFAAIPYRLNDDPTLDFKCVHFSRAFCIYASENLGLVPGRDVWQLHYRQQFSLLDVPYFYSRPLIKRIGGPVYNVSGHAMNIVRFIPDPASPDDSRQTFVAVEPQLAGGKLSIYYSWTQPAGTEMELPESVKNDIIRAAYGQNATGVFEIHGDTDQHQTRPEIGNLVPY